MRTPKWTPAFLRNLLNMAICQLYAAEIAFRPIIDLAACRRIERALRLLGLYPPAPDFAVLAEAVRSGTTQAEADVATMTLVAAIDRELSVAREVGFLVGLDLKRRKIQPSRCEW